MYCTGNRAVFFPKYAWFKAGEVSLPIMCRDQEAVCAMCSMGDTAGQGITLWLVASNQYDSLCSFLSFFPEVYHLPLQQSSICCVPLISAAI